MTEDPIFITREVLDDIHSDSLTQFGGSPGVRDEGLVESALGAAQNAFYYGSGDLYEVAAAYAFHIAQAQAFLDGNKRTGIGAALTFLEYNGIQTRLDDGTIYDAMIAIAEKRMNKAELSQTLRSFLVPFQDCAVRAAVHDIFKDIEHDGRAWMELRNRLEVARAVLPSCNWRPAITFPGLSQEAVSEAKRQVFTAADLAAEESARAMLHRNRENEWPDLSPEAAFFLIVAIDQMIDFLELCYNTDGEDVRSLFPYSGQSDGELIMWLFYRWWIGPGIRRWLDRVVTDRRLFEFYFRHSETN